MESVNVTQLPKHTKVETLVGHINDVKGKRSEGFTKSFDLLSPPPYGYIVGTGAGEFDANELISDEIRFRVSELVDLYSGHDKLFLGGWVSDEGKVVIEVSQWIMDEDTAIQTGKRDKQISIWDIANKKEIKL